ncbi:MAG: class I SAM-dependent methyltransferase [Bacilli bacterium]|jgi:predicted SAM-dependent methyltransferase
MGLSLNIGCGNKILETINGYPCVNVDIRPLKGVNIVCDIRYLPFPDESFDKILASDVIEHFPISETKLLLFEWSRVLKVGGNIKFRTPNLRWVSSMYLKTGDAKFMSWHIFGGQDYLNNFHYVIFDRNWLVSMCNEFLLDEVNYLESGSNFELVMIKRGK